MDSVGVHRPRNVDWKRAAALLYGDWGTSKAYVIGAAFVYPVLTSAGQHEPLGYRSLPIILAVCLLTAFVGYNYSVICKYFPDGGGDHYFQPSGVAARPGVDGDASRTFGRRLRTKLESLRRCHPGVERRRGGGELDRRDEARSGRNHGESDRCQNGPQSHLGGS